MWYVVIQTEGCIEWQALVDLLSTALNLDPARLVMFSCVSVAVCARLSLCALATPTAVSAMSTRSPCMSLTIPTE